jgi:hypothetical protein
MLKPGTRLKSAVCGAEFMIIKAAEGDELACGGAACGVSADRIEGETDKMNGCVIGKRYINAAETIEVLCIKSGEGSLYCNDEELMTKDTKKLPSSD